MTALRDPVSTQGEVCTGMFADVLTQTYTTVFTSDCACDARPPKKEINILSPVLHTEGLKGKQTLTCLQRSAQAAPTTHRLGSAGLVP